MAKVNYGWWANGFRGGVYPTVESLADGAVFATFTEARQKLGDHFRALETAAGDARSRARSLKKAGVRNGEWSI